MLHTDAKRRRHAIFLRHINNILATPAVPLIHSSMIPSLACLPSSTDAVAVSSISKIGSKQDHATAGAPMQHDQSQRVARFAPLGDDEHVIAVDFIAEDGGELKVLSLKSVVEGCAECIGGMFGLDDVGCVAERGG